MDALTAYGPPMEREHDMRFGDLRGRHVVSLEDAHKIGSVESLLLDLDTQKVQAVRVKSGSVFSGKHVILLSDIKAVGDDAITVQNQDAIRDEKSVEGLAGYSTIDDINGARVMSESGQEAGTVADLEVDLSTGTITGYVLKGSLINRIQGESHLIPVSTVKQVSEKMIIVADHMIPA